MDKTVKTLVFWIVVVVAGALLWQTVKSGGNEPKVPEISYSQFLSEVEAGDVAKVSISNNEVTGWRNDKSTFHLVAPTSQEGMIQALREQKVEIWFRDTPKGDWSTWLMNLAPLILLGALWFFMIRQLRAGARARAQANAGGTTAIGPAGQ